MRSVLERLRPTLGVVVLRSEATNELLGAADELLRATNELLGGVQLHNWWRGRVRKGCPKPKTVWQSKPVSKLGSQRILAVGIVNLT